MWHVITPDFDGFVYSPRQVDDKIRQAIFNWGNPNVHVTYLRETPEGDHQRLLVGER